MDINIRQAILQNITGNSADQLEATIIDAIKDGEEKVLPGLGVLLEIIWKHSDQAGKVDMLHALESGVRTA